MGLAAHLYVPGVLLRERSGDDPVGAARRTTLGRLVAVSGLRATRLDGRLRSVGEGRTCARHETRHEGEGDQLLQCTVS
jgi:hypothetical protein